MRSEIDLYRTAYDLALQQSPDMEQLSAFSGSIEKHLTIYAESLRKAMTPLQVLLTADKEKDMFGYRKVDLEANLETFLTMEQMINGVALKAEQFRHFIEQHREGMKVMEEKLENVEVENE
jgi:hypothetical protein